VVDAHEQEKQGALVDNVRERLAIFRAELHDLFASREQAQQLSAVCRVKLTHDAIHSLSLTLNRCSDAVRGGEHHDGCIS
jgi:hypothetical protein